MRVSRSGYYGWLNHIYPAKKDRDEEIVQVIKEIFTVGRCVYGDVATLLRTNLFKNIILFPRILQVINNHWQNGF